MSHLASRQPIFCSESQFLDQLYIALERIWNSFHLLIETEGLLHLVPAPVQRTFALIQIAYSKDGSFLSKIRPIQNFRMLLHVQPVYHLLNCWSDQNSRARKQTLMKPAFLCEVVFPLSSARPKAKLPVLLLSTLQLLAYDSSTWAVRTSSHSFDRDVENDIEVTGGNFNEASGIESEVAFFVKGPVVW